MKLVGNHEQRQRLLPRLAKGEISGFALTEKDAGYDALINVIWEGSNGILTLWIGRKDLAEYFMHGTAFLEFQITEMLRATPFFVKTAVRSFNALSVCEKDGGDAGTFDAVWEHFVARKSRELAQTTLWVAARHRPGLARKQLLMTRLVNAGLHLFAVETPLWYKSQKELRDTEHVHSLVTYSCSRIKRSSIPSHCSPSGHRRGTTTPTCIARRRPFFPEKPTGWKKASFAAPRWRMARRPGKRVWYALPQNSEGPVRG